MSRGEAPAPALWGSVPASHGKCQRAAVRPLPWHGGGFARAGSRLTRAILVTGALVCIHSVGTWLTGVIVTAPSLREGSQWPPPMLERPDRVAVLFSTHVPERTRSRSDAVTQSLK